ncbi:MAG: IS5 family transposase [Acidobacteriota bacterium]|nr:IS5 family transposase [Acidobacteriota bacterium]
MRGHDEHQEAMFSYISAEKRVPENHPLRRVRELVDGALKQMSPQLAGLYSRYGRPSIAPEKLLRALLLQCFYGVRSERLLIEQLQYNLLFRWFVGLNMEEDVWDVTVFTKNRERLLQGEVAGEFFERVLAPAREQGLLSDEHFTVDGTLIEAWANRKSFHPKADPPQRGSGYRGTKLLRDTHESKTDPEARLYKRSRVEEARPSYLGHVLTENRNGLIVQACVTQSATVAEREAGLEMVRVLRRKQENRTAMTLGADKAYQEERFVSALRELQVRPHIAEYEKPCWQWPNWLTSGERTEPGYEISQRKRKLVEKAFAWMKSVAGLRRTKLRGRRRVDWIFRLAAAACNLIRLAKLLPAQT